VGHHGLVAMQGQGHLYEQLEQAGMMRGEPCMAPMRMTHVVEPVVVKDPKTTTYMLVVNARMHVEAEEDTLVMPGRTLEVAVICVVEEDHWECKNGDDIALRRR
jgi:hypothetical protein